MWLFRLLLTYSHFKSQIRTNKETSTKVLVFLMSFKMEINNNLWYNYTV